jgi:hypothetical protein
VLRQIRAGVQSLGGQTGAITDRAVTFNDLIALDFVVSRNGLLVPGSAFGTSTSGTGTTTPGAGWNLSAGATTIDDVAALDVVGATLTGDSASATLTVPSSGGGSTWDIGDGTDMVVDVTSLLVTGGTISGSSHAATLTIPTGGGGASTYPPSTLDPRDLNSDGGTATLSSDGMTLTMTGGGSPYVRSTSPRYSGKWYFEAKLISSTQYNNFNIGVAPGAFNSPGLNIPPNFMGHSPYNDTSGADGHINSGMGLGANTGDTICVAVDMENQNGWVRKNGGSWDNISGDDPASNTGGLMGVGTNAYISSHGIFKQGAIYVLLAGTNGVISVNFGATAFGFALPSGFEAWG